MDAREESIRPKLDVDSGRVVLCKVEKNLGGKNGGQCNGGGGKIESTFHLPPRHVNVPNDMKGLKLQFEMNLLNSRCKSSHLTKSVKCVERGEFVAHSNVE